MKVIYIPEDITFEVDGKKMPLVFKKVVGGLLDMAPVFGTRMGARRAVSIERIFEKANGSATLDDQDYELLVKAIVGRDTPAGNNEAFTWHPAAARAMEKAGWFEAIVDAKEV